MNLYQEMMNKQVQDLLGNQAQPEPMGPPLSAMQPKQQQPLMPLSPPKEKKSGSGAIPIIDRSDYDEIVKRINEKGLESLGKQDEGLEGLRQQIGNALAHSNNNLDLTPLASLADAWTDSNMAKDYNRPDYDKQNQNIQGLEQALQRGRNDLSENELGLLKTQLGFEGDRVAAQERAAAQAESRSQHADAMKEAREARGDQHALQEREYLDKNYGTKLQEATTFQRNVNEFRDLIKNGVPKFGPERARAESLYADMTIAYKNPAGLGALSGPDEGIIKSALGPNDLGGFLKSATINGGDAGVQQALADVAARNEKVFNGLKGRAQRVHVGENARQILEGYDADWKRVNPNSAPQGPQTREEMLRELGGQ